MKTFFGIIFGYSLLLSSCKSADDRKVEPSGPKFTINLLKSDANEIAAFTDFYQDITIIPLKLPKASLIASFDKVLIYDSSYFVLDKKFSALYRFDMAGNLVRTYGKLGLGPGEFKRIDDFDIFEKDVYMLSNDNRTIFVYNLTDGAFLRTMPTQRFGSGLSMLTENSYLLHCNYNNSDPKKDYNVYLINNDGGVLDRFFPFDPDKSSMILPFTGFFQTAYHRQQYYCDAFDEMIYTYDNRTFKPYVSVQISSDFIKDNKKDFKRIVMDKTLMDPSLRYIGNSYQESDRFIIISYIKELVLKTAIFDKKNESVKIIRKGIADPLINLVEGPFLLTPENKFIYAVSGESLQDMRKTDASKYKRLSPAFQKSFDSAVDSSAFSYYILTATNRE